MYCTKCGTKNIENAIYCKQCGFDLKNNLTENQILTKDVSPQKVGLGGWLVLVGLSIIYNIVVLIIGLNDYMSALSIDYAILGFNYIIRFEFFASLAFIVCNIYLLYLYFKKNKKFPNYYIIFIILVFIQIIIDYSWMASLTAPTQELQKIIDDSLSSNSNEIIRSFIVSIIWIIYMMKSKRVKTTFIN